MLQLITSVADRDGDLDRGGLVSGEDLGVNDFGDIVAATSAAAELPGGFEGALGAMVLEVVVATAAALASVDLRRAAIEAAGLRLRGELGALDQAGRAFNAVAEQINVAASATISGMALVVTTILAWHVFSPYSLRKRKPLKSVNAVMRKRASNFT